MGAPSPSCWKEAVRPWAGPPLAGWSYGSGQLTTAPEWNLAVQTVPSSLPWSCKKLPSGTSQVPASVAPGWGWVDYKEPMAQP